MSAMIEDLDGNQVEVFIRITPEGYVDAICRADTRVAWDAAAAAQALTYEDAEGAAWPVAGAVIDHLGPVTLVAGTYSEDGTELTAPVLDLRHHVNLRMGPALTDRGLWKTLAITWTQHGAVADQNASEIGRVIGSVALIDPDTIHSLDRVWAK